MMNSGKTKFKRTSIDRLLNFIILGVSRTVVIQLTVRKENEKSETFIYSFPLFLFIFIVVLSFDFFHFTDCIFSAFYVPILHCSLWNMGDIDRFVSTDYVQLMNIVLQTLHIIYMKNSSLNPMKA